MIAPSASSATVLLLCVRVSSLDIVTLVIAVAGLSLAVASLGWQVFAWHASGSKVKVETELGILGYPDDRMDSYIGVTVRNVGRTAIDVTSWALALPDGMHLAILEPEPWSGPEPPVRLEPGQAQTWRLLAEKTRNSLVLEGYSPDTVVKGRVTLATGKVLVAKEGCKLV